MHSYRQAYTLELLSQESCIYGWRCYARTSREGGMFFASDF